MARKRTSGDEEAAHKAQEIIYDAWDSGTAKRRVALAQKALSISPLCADAHVLLAEHGEPGSSEELDHWRSGVAAGQAAIGKQAFAEFEGHFWGFLETRPYMRARFGLARALWARDLKAEAIDHLGDMLRLNPNDNQGVRYTLAAWLLEAGRDDDLIVLLDQYPDEGSANWAWTAVLAAFRRSGESEDIRKRLDDAMRENGHVPAYLLGARPMPKRLPPFLSPGAPDEAVHYCAEFAEGWKRTKGALDWLRSAAMPPKTKRPTSGNRRLPG